MIKCLLLDDDPSVVRYVRSYIENTPFLKLTGAYTASEQALTALQNEPVQLIFMDVNLPGISGIDMTKILMANKDMPDPLVILISGFDHFALEGYKINALDYLLKPIRYEDFFQVVLKAKKMLDAVPYLYDDYLFLRVEYELQKVYLRDILYLESFKDYVKVFTRNNSEPVKALTTLRGIEEKLPAASFVRIHRSFIVSLDKIDSISKTTVRIGKIVIPITPQYKDNLKDFISKWF